jgi:hypothetical protein
LKIQSRLVTVWLVRRSEKHPTYTLDEFLHLTDASTRHQSPRIVSRRPKTQSKVKAPWCQKRDRRCVPSPDLQQSEPSQTRKPSQTQIEENLDARTTPPTSLFLPMQLSNSVDLVPTQSRNRKPGGTDLTKGASTLSANPNPKLPNRHSAARSDQKNDETSLPASQPVGGSIVCI